MNDNNDEMKTKQQLLEELKWLRERVAASEKKPESGRERAGETGPELKEHQDWFDQIGDSILIFDRETKHFLDCNQAALDCYGYSLDELRTMTPYQLHPPDELKKVDEYIDDERTASPHTYTHITKSGESLQVDVRTNPIKYKGQKAWISVVRDITERYQTEKALQEANYALQRRAIQLEASAAVSHAITSIFEIDELLSQTVDLIRSRFGFYHAGIFLLDESGEWAVLKEATGEAGEKMKAQGHRLAVDDSSMVGWTATHSEPRIALYAQEDAVRFANPLLPHTRSEMTLPLRVRGRSLGVLNVQSTEEAAFDDDDVRALQSMADQIAVAIENARRISDEASLLEATSPVYQASRLLTTATATEEVADAIIKSVANTGADGCLVVEFEFSPRGKPEALMYLGVWRRDREPQFEAGARIAISESPFPFEMVSSLWAVPDVEQDERLPESARAVFQATGVRALVNIPLRSGNKVIGQAVVLRTTPGAFSEAALRLYEVLSDQAAVALERAQLLESAQRVASREQQARQMIDRIRQSVDVEQTLQTAAEELAQAMEAPHVSIELNLETLT